MLELYSDDIRTQMMTTLKWHKFDCRWNNRIVILLFKCFTGKAPDYLCSKLTFTHSTHDYSTRGNSSNTLVVSQFKSKSGLKKTFHFRGSNL